MHNILHIEVLLSLINETSSRCTYLTAIQYSIRLALPVTDEHLHYF